MSEATEREAICNIGASIFARGLTAGSSGNISLRMDDGWLMTPTNASLGRLDPARLSKLGHDGHLISGDPPTQESFLHRVMYEERPDTGAVVHLHSTHSVAVSCLRSEEHTSELQSHVNLVCRLLLENKKKEKKEQTLKQKTKKKNKIT